MIRKPLYRFLYASRRCLFSSFETEKGREADIAID